VNTVAAADNFNVQLPVFSSLPFGFLLLLEDQQYWTDRGQDRPLLVGDYGGCLSSAILDLDEIQYAYFYYVSNFSASCERQRSLALLAFDLCRKTG
jgi:hypothetical protein